MCSATTRSDWERTAQPTSRSNSWRACALSLPSMELVARQPPEYRDAVLPPAVTARLAIEAASPQPWYRWVGEAGAVLGIERFGASAPYQRIYQEFGLTVDNVVRRAKELLRT